MSPNDNFTANFVQEAYLLKHWKVFFCTTLMKTPCNWQIFHEYFWGTLKLPAGRWYMICSYRSLSMYVPKFTYVYMWAQENLTEGHRKGWYRIAEVLSEFQWLYLLPLPLRSAVYLLGFPIKWSWDTAVQPLCCR